MQSQVTQVPAIDTLNISSIPIDTHPQPINAVSSSSTDTSTQQGPLRPNRPQTYPLGTLEDVQRDDYESPIGAMFFRAWDRYRTAEEVRQAEAQSTTMQERNDENIPPQLNPLASSSLASTSPPNLNPLASPFNPPRSSGRPYEIGPARLRSIPHRPRTNFHTPFYFGHHQVQSLPRPEPDPMDERPNPIDAQISQRPAPSQAESLKIDFACKVCVEQKINTFCEPCMHACMCQWCAAIVRDECRTETGRFDGRLWRCPICRARITQVRKFFVE